MKMYLAGGWFTPEQEQEHSKLYEALKDINGLDVYNPRLEGEIDTDTSVDKMSAILLSNVDNIKSSDFVVVIYDGKDTGTIWEAGYAYANKKPIIYYAEKLGGKKFNLMLAKTGYFVDNLESLVDLITTNIEHNNSLLLYKDVNNSYKGEIE